MTISFKEQELSAMREAIENYLDILEDGDDTCGQIGELLDNGLGSALYKLFKGRNGAKHYERYVKNKQSRED